MTAALIYALIAIGIIVVVGLLLRPSREGAAADAEISGEHVRGLWEGRDSAWPSAFLILPIISGCATS